MNGARGFVLFLPLALASCVSFGWSRDLRHAPPAAGTIEALEVGRSTLADCLQALGAPLYVWEYKGDGAALAWGWADEQHKGVSVSIPLYQQTSASLSYDSGHEKLRGVVLLFDRDLVLEQLRKGWLRDFERDFGRRRPAFVDS